MQLRNIFYVLPWVIGLTLYSISLAFTIKLYVTMWSVNMNTVTHYRFCQTLWPLSHMVAFVRHCGHCHCGLCQTLWPLSDIVAFVRHCDHCQTLWPLSDIAITVRHCDHCQTLRSLSDIVITVRHCDHCQTLWPLSLWRDHYHTVTGESVVRWAIVVTQKCARSQGWHSMSGIRQTYGSPEWLLSWRHSWSKLCVW